jgi:hypothetical protein
LLEDFPPSRVGQGVKHFVSDCGLSHADTIHVLGVIRSDRGILQRRDTFVNT